jgi:hypothetical protein
MFELTQQLAKLQDVNPRSELHGDEHKLAADLKFELKMPNDCLAFFDESLKSSLYRKDGAVQGELIDDPHHLTSLKFPKLGTLHWDHDFAGYVTTFHIGATEKDNIVLGDCQLDKWKLDPQDGGTVGITFRCIAHPGEEELGRLCSMIQQNVTITLDPPEADAE